MNNKSRTHRLSSRIRTLALFVVGLSALPASLIALDQPASATTECSTGIVEENTSGNVVVLTFTADSNTDGVCTFTVPDGVFVVDYLVVAGGGGGGSGGGGGGGVVYSDNPQSVDPGQHISITVGRGGVGGKGGISSSGDFPTNGSNSSFGSVEAIGGGAGGSWNRYASPTGSPNGITGGSSGGDAYDAETETGVTSSGTVIVGGTSLGNAGGASSGGGYSAGGGGGGAGGPGESSRLPEEAPAFDVYGCHLSWEPIDCTSLFYGGGAGGAGFESDISGETVDYGCGGGGGINSNNNNVIADAGGPAGCSSAGRGSNWGFFSGEVNQVDNATSAEAGFGGGGGGTDPEDVLGGNGGSGVVIVRYTIVDLRCPNDDAATVAQPIACPTELTVVADDSSKSVTVMGSPISFTGVGATVTVRSAPRANPTSGNLTWSVSGNTLAISVPSGSSLVGGTYPVVYRITQDGRTSDSYVLVTVEDPGQLTPGTVPLDPRDGAIVLPRIELGASPNVRLCLTLEDNLDGLSLSAADSSGVTITNPISGRLVLVGTNANVQAAVNAISITAASGARLVPTGISRNLDVNVSNTNNGGNGSCTFGTSSSITLKNLGLSTAQHLNIDLD